MGLEESKVKGPERETPPQGKRSNVYIIDSTKLPGRPVLLTEQPPEWAPNSFEGGRSVKELLRSFIPPSFIAAQLMSHTRLSSESAFDTRLDILVDSDMKASKRLRLSAKNSKDICNIFVSNEIGAVTARKYMGAGFSLCGHAKMAEKAGNELERRLGLGVIWCIPKWLARNEGESERVQPLCDFTGEDRASTQLWLDVTAPFSGSPALLGYIFTGRYRSNAVTYELGVKSDENTPMGEVPYPSLWQFCTSLRSRDQPLQDGEVSSNFMEASLKSRVDFGNPDSDFIEATFKQVFLRQPGVLLTHLRNPISLGFVARKYLFNNQKPVLAAVLAAQIDRNLLFKCRIDQDGLSTAATLKTWGTPQVAITAGLQIKNVGVGVSYTPSCGIQFNFEDVDVPPSSKWFRKS